MIIYWDNVNGTVVEWDDGAEEITVFRPTGDLESSGQYPFEILKTNYELVQYVVAYATPDLALKTIPTFFKGNNVEKAKDIFRNTMTHKVIPDGGALKNPRIRGTL